MYNKTILLNLVFDVTEITATSIVIFNRHVEKFFLKLICFCLTKFSVVLSAFIRANKKEGGGEGAVVIANEAPFLALMWAEATKSWEIWCHDLSHNFFSLMVKCFNL